MFSRPFLTTLTLTFLIHLTYGQAAQTAKGEIQEKNNGRLFSLVEDKLEIKIGEYVNYFTKWLESINDKYLGETDIGRMLHYCEMKPNLEKETARSARKKMSMSMMPLIFHMGASSTWMLLTAIMAAKSVAIGMALLIFKIAVSSAKLASFFTLLKGKQHDHHQSWSWSPPPHYEHHGHERSFSEIDPPIIHHNDHSNHQQSDWHSYIPEWTPSEAQDYHTLPASFKDEITYKDEKIIDERRKKFM